MILWRNYVLTSLLFVSAFSRGDAQPVPALTTAEYRTQLDELLAATRLLNSNDGAIPTPLQHLPYSWRVHTDQLDFEIATEGLRGAVRRYEEEKDAGNAAAIQKRVESLRHEFDGFERTPPDVSSRRTALNAILARPEFRDVHGSTWAERLRRWVLQHLFRFLAKLFRSSAIPTVGKYFVYGLMGLAGLGLLYVVYRSILRHPEFEDVVPKDLPVSAKEWTIWLADARAAAANGDWREAVHLAYWAGISFLERQGLWKPDRARTPREYLRLISPQAEQRETLSALTRIFELTWYAKRPAGEATFSRTLEELEKLGCR
jgi:Domain of unknown function (DUF4129)